MRKYSLAVLFICLVISSCGWQLRSNMESSAEIESIYIGSQLATHESGPESIIQGFDQRLNDLDIEAIEAISKAQIGLIILSEQQNETVLGLSTDLFEQQSRLSKTVNYQIWFDNNIVIQNDQVSTFRDLSEDQSNAAAKNREADLIYQEINVDLIDQIIRRLQLYLSTNDAN